MFTFEFSSNFLEFSETLLIKIVCKIFAIHETQKQNWGKIFVWLGTYVIQIDFDNSISLILYDMLKLSRFKIIISSDYISHLI